MNKQNFQEAQRAQRSLLAGVEKRTLIWLAERLPSWINSDHLTLLGLAAMFAAGVSYWWSKEFPPALFLVNVCLAINWFGDSCDGTLARVRQHQRPRYGFYVDHIVDAFGALFLVGGLALSGMMSLPVAMALLIVYFLLSIEVYLATYTVGTFRISYFKWGPTELRFLLCIGNVFLYYRPVVNFMGQERLLFDIGGIVGIIGIVLIVLLSVIRNTTALYKQEPLP